MDYTKTCEKCKIEKILDDFGNLSKGRGQKIYKRNICKDCMREQRKSKNAKIEYKPKKIKSPGLKIDGDKKPDYKIERNFNMFTSQEIEILKNLISKNNEIMKLVNSKIELEPVSKIKRTPKSLNIEVDIFDKLQEYSKKSNISVSDIVNKLLREGLSNIG